MSEALTIRPYAGPSDLPLLHRVASACWSRAAPHAIPHVGDVTWALYQHEPEVEWPKQTVLVERSAEPVAFGILWLPQTLQSAIHPDHRQPAVYDALLDWLEREAGDDVDGGLDVQVLESDDRFREHLRTRGYEPIEGGTWHHARSLDEAVDAPTVPGGYFVRNVAGERDATRRVDVHRAAFAPSKFTVPAYLRVRTLPPYDESLDLVVEAPDGSFAAFAQVWHDATSGTGELEPVGTHPDHRRRGLARAVCTEACRRLRERGAHWAVVYSVTDEARALYESAGFPVVDRHVEHRLPR